MSELSDEYVHAEIGKIIDRFDLYQCYECAQAIMQWLRSNRIEGQIIQLKTFYADEDYIISDRLGSDESISANGKHYGVRVRGLVFDNLSVAGMLESEWKADFHCQSERFIFTDIGE